SCAGTRLAQHRGGAGSGAAVKEIERRERKVRQFLVVPKKRGSRYEETDVKTVVPALAIQEGDELIEARRAATGAGKGEAARGTIQKISVADQDTQGGAARNLF